MKKYFTFLLVPLLYACQPKTVENDGGLIVELSIADNNAAEEDINPAIETIKNRMDYMGCEDPVIAFSADKKRIQVRLPLIMDSAFYRDCVLGKGTFSIIQGFRNIYFGDNIENLNRAILKNPEINAQIPFDTIYPHQSDSLNPLFRILSPSWSNLSSIMGYALPKDTALVGSILKNEKIRKFLPEGYSFRWSKDLIENHCYLHVARKPHKDNIVTFDMLADVEKHKGTSSDKYDVQLTLKSDYNKNLANVTELGLPIVILIDNKVFSAPQGTTTIPDGKATIGNLSLDEANYLVALFKYGSLKLDLKIEKMTVIDLSKPAEQPIKSNEPATDSSVLFVDPEQLPDKKNL